MSAEELAKRGDETTACPCFFRGDTSPQMGHALAAASRVLRRFRRRPSRICWETNGGMNPGVLRHVARRSLDSGGTVKFDLKAWDARLHEALRGADNHRTLENFRWLAEFGRRRGAPPLAVAGTVLIPGYVDEVGPSPDSSPRSIPHSLLGFHPQFFMSDLPATSRAHANRCERAARETGLANVRLGNRHLLSDAY